ncbi:hypothetical protein E4631_20215 [Hymenobacter sp. UV11]|uniref:hypothetical protein n=1 Tax=Hymenobacter sp. UV11 TaxID=1849735 RepID=UPI00106084CC|nr:hypothetical protein [Hymenobacter sp. UV11]TDN36920.1 hypothetical protein A8B98_05860 [Hymenobacter sp. UV11]TFZ64325.1 hypothetical protein E4631_20215 [Hymenobacter sp. UV11]
MKKLAYLLPVLLLAGFTLASCEHCKTGDPTPARTLTTSEGQTATTASTTPSSSACTMNNGHMAMNGSMMNGK